MTSIVPQDEFAVADNDEFTFTGSGGLKRKRSAYKINKLETFYHLLDVMLNGYVFVSVGAPAPHPDWAGRADIRLEWWRRSVYSSLETAPNFT